MPPMKTFLCDQWDLCEFPFSCAIEILLLTSNLMCISDDATSLTLARQRRLTGSSCPDYAVLLHDSSLLAIACERHFKFEFDSVNPVKVVESSTTEPSSGT